MNTNEFGTSTSGTGNIKESVHKLADQGSETVHVLKDRASELADQLKTQYSAALSRTMDFIQARPIAAIGIALGLGYMSRTIFKLGMLAGAGLLVTKIVAPKLKGASSMRDANLGGTAAEGSVITTSSY